MGIELTLINALRVAESSILNGYPTKGGRDAKLPLTGLEVSPINGRNERTGGRRNGIQELGHISTPKIRKISAISGAPGLQDLWRAIKLNQAGKQRSS